MNVQYLTPKKSIQELSAMDFWKLFQGGQISLSFKRTDSIEMGIPLGQISIGDPDPESPSLLIQRMKSQILEKRSGRDEEWILTQHILGAINNNFVENEVNMVGADSEQSLMDQFSPTRGTWIYYYDPLASWVESAKLKIMLTETIDVPVPDGLFMLMAFRPEWRQRDRFMDVAFKWLSGFKK